MKPAGRPLIFGHRGSPRHAQENSLRAFDLAFAEGADGVELDVRLTGDGVAVVFHDDALPGGEQISSHSFRGISAAARRQDLSLVTLEETLQHLAGKGYLDIEIKEEGLPQVVVSLAERMLPRDSYVFSSFLPEVIAELSELAPAVPTIWIAEECRNVEQTLEQLDKLGAAGFAVWYEEISAEFAVQFDRRDIPLFAYTVNKTEIARRLADWGVVGIISDVPGEVVREG